MGIYFFITLIFKNEILIVGYLDYFWFFTVTHKALVNTLYICLCILV